MFNNNKPNREFQSGLKTEERRRSRQDDRLRLRRADRENRLQKKRQTLTNRQRTYGDNNNNNNNNQNQSSSSNLNIQNLSPQKQQELQRRQQMLQQLPQYVQGCYSDHPATQFECTQRIRKLLSIEREPPIKAVIDSGVVTRLVQFLQFEQFDRLQFEAAWALTNIASGTAENTAVIIRYGAVPIFVKLLESPSYEVREQAIWALGNIAGDSPECRNLVLSHGALSRLLPICCPTQHTTQQQVTLLRNATWTLSNFCRGKPCPEWKYVKLAIKALTMMITCDDQEILQDSCWAFSYLSDIQSTNEEEQIKCIINSGCLDRLITLLDHESPHVRHPALRTIGNIVTGNDENTQKVINLGVLKKLHRLMTTDRAPIKREACWTISNITAGSREQIEAVICANLFQPLIHILKNEKYEISKEALWAISNATSGGTDVQIAFLVNQGVIGPLCEFFGRSLPPKIMMVALEGIENILAAGDRLHNSHPSQSNGSRSGYNQFSQYVEECGGSDYLENLQSNQSVPDEIYDKAASIIRDYFDGEETNQPFIQSTNNQQQQQQQTTTATTTAINE